MQIVLFMRFFLHTLLDLVASGRESMLGWYVLLALLFLSVLLSGCALQSGLLPEVF